MDGNYFPSHMKSEKENFVTGHTGTTIEEILLVCLAPTFVGLFLFHGIRNILLLSERKCNNEQCVTEDDFGKGNAHDNDEIPEKNRIQQEQHSMFGILVFVESLVLLLPITICQTDLLYPWGIRLLCVECILALVLYFHNHRKGRLLYVARSVQDVSSPQRSELPFLTAYRSTVSFLTFVAILAVDFHFFPRRFAKTEVTGYGLMDLGAGSFVVSGGLVSQFARNKSKSNSSSLDRMGGRMYEVMKKVVFHCFPLIVMGIVRLITTKGIEYQEHVSEYGVHWNFFFTISFVTIFSSLVRTAPVLNDELVPVLLLIIYQYFLSHCGIQEYIENAPRFNEGTNGVMSSLCNFFAANREGILGIMGYLVLFLSSESIGQYCLWDRSLIDSEPKPGNRSDRTIYCRRGIRLLLVSLFLWVLHWLTTSVLGIPVSRRSTNASFISWTLAHNITTLFFIHTAFQLGNMQFMSGRILSQNTPIFAAVNRHGLVVFILANLMTGVVNLSVDTMKATRGEAILIIFLYLCLVGAVALIIDYRCYRRNNKIKND